MVLNPCRNVNKLCRGRHAWGGCWDPCSTSWSVPSGRTTPWPRIPAPVPVCGWIQPLPCSLGVQRDKEPASACSLCRHVTPYRPSSSMVRGIVGQGGGICWAWSCYQRAGLCEGLAAPPTPPPLPLPPSPALEHCFCP